MKPIVYPFLILVVFFVACKTPNKETLDQLVDDVSYETEELEANLERRLGDTTYLNQFRFGDTLYHFYQDRKFKPVWALLMVNDSTAEVLLQPFVNAAYEGFQSDYYRLPEIRNILDNLKNGKKSELYDELVHLEMLTSDNMLSLHHDRVWGRTDPVKVFDGAYHLPRREFPEFNLFDILHAKKYPAVLKENEIQDTAYVKLKEMLAVYVNRIKSGEEWATIDTTGVKKLEPGDTTTLMPLIAQKLHEMQVISEAEMKEADSNTYKKSFAKYIRRFQQRFGLYDDAILGRRTFGLLNISLQDRANEVAANMERIRWFELPEEKPYVSVNLPFFELTLHYEDSIQKMATCIGKPRKHDYYDRMERYKKEGKAWLRPPDHETPQIYSKIAYMVINPTWTVPTSIVTREMWWKMKTDSHYLVNAGYGVFYKKKEIRSDTINWRKFNPRKLPFEIVQKSGEENALGKVKFIFPNKYSIYLHDTPQKSKFSWTGRAVSHGCVRVEDPVLLGEFVTQNIDTMDSDDFRIHMGYEPRNSIRLEEYDPEDSTAHIQPIDETHVVWLNRRMPVFFLYRTISFSEDWEVQYRNDVYDKNRLIIQAMSF